MWRTGVALWTLMSEAQAVMAYRMMGMAGYWTVHNTENERMYSEKGPAFVEANLAATRAAIDGKRFDQVAQAWMQPLQRKVSSNRRRLAKSGPKLD